MQHDMPHLPPMFLQQCGLQLLQALAAPVQQLLLEPDDAIGAHLLTAVHGGQQQQLYALRVALSGCAVVSDDPDIFTTGEFCLCMVLCRDQLIWQLANCDLLHLQHVCDWKALVWAHDCISLHAACGNMLLQCSSLRTHIT
jgi:hypothetical protein